jgi:integrase
MTKVIRKKPTNKPNKPNKPTKPFADFPLFPHATRRWAKKIRGKMHYFGPWSDPEGALKKYLDQKDDLFAGRTPRVSGEGVTMLDVANRFLTAKRQRCDTAELSQRTFADYLAVCHRIIVVFGKRRLVVDLAAEDFEHLRAELAKTRGPVALGNEIQRVRTVFKYAYDVGLIDRPVRFGPMFTKPSRKTMRQARHARGPRMFEAHEIRAMVDAAGPQLKAMILLGVNAGFGNSDVASLPLKALNLGTGWVDHPRPKTAVPRRVPLWPETLHALSAAIKERPEPKSQSHQGLVFITKYGQPWSSRFRRTAKIVAELAGQRTVEYDGPALASSDSPITKEFAKLLKLLGIERRGVSFYALRHTFETVGGESLDQVAVDAIMGHSREDMASVYRERISDERLKAVTDHVRGWLFGKAVLAKKESGRRKGSKRPSAAA